MPNEVYKMGPIKVWEGKPEPAIFSGSRRSTHCFPPKPSEQLGILLVQAYYIYVDVLKQSFFLCLLSC